jgi:hypothetical protein
MKDEGGSIETAPSLLSVASRVTEISQIASLAG